MSFIQGDPRDARILYPHCLAPVAFIEYRRVDANASFQRAGDV